jgi:hypothetical protein
MFVKYLLFISIAVISATPQSKILYCLNTHIHIHIHTYHTNNSYNQRGQSAEVTSTAFLTPFFSLPMEPLCWAEACNRDAGGAFEAVVAVLVLAGGGGEDEEGARVWPMREVVGELGEADED